jgi:hypothetical protein
MKAQLHLFLTSVSNRMISFMPQAIYPWYPFDGKLGVPQNWSGQPGQEEKSYASAKD